MKQHLAAQIKLRAPMLCRGDDLPFLNCGDGWYQLIVNMMDELEPMAQEMKQLYGKEPKLFHIETHHATMQVVIDDISKAMDEIIERYEEKSETICVSCGAPGRPQGKWVEILCNSCFKKEVT
ncbi:hypothetical protein [Methylophaga thiooxydans]|uniref:hypothetical protein n=1 Tax=Methylophaga thiooxydans TaxID=392484 RepID=UPI0023522B56|nr:hypothetical protein [Methylophaga thiooxydans]